MTYVLCSLLSDDATARNDTFAQGFAARFPPFARFHDVHPDHQQVKEAVEACRNALIFGHDGGGSVRGAATGPPWANPEEFADMFRGARVWVYACDTRAKKLEDDLDSFGRRAKAAGVRVFAGHCAAITAVPEFEALPALRETLHRALERAFRAFLNGENNAGELRRLALRGAGRGRSALFQPRTIEETMESLRVLADPG